MTITAAPTISTELLDALSVTQLEHIIACRRARAASTEPTWQDEYKRIAANADPETCRAYERLDVVARCRRLADLWRAHGVDDDLAGASIVRALIAAGVGADEAGAAVREAGIGWRPRTDAERLVAAARDMLTAGFPPEVVRRAVAMAFDDEIDAVEAA